MIKILDFYADWCNPCKTMLPIFDELKTEFPNIEFQKVNIEESELAAKLAVTSIPTFIILKNDVEVSRKNGVISKQVFKDWLQNYDQQNQKSE
jgi:thioredoxin 1